MTNDPPIHLAQYQICDKRPHSEASVNVPVWITQSSLDGIQTMIKFCDGLQRGGNGTVPGSFELVMFYRTLRGAIDKAEEEHVKARMKNMTTITFTFDRWKEIHEELTARPTFRQATGREFQHWYDPSHVPGVTPVGVLDEAVIVLVEDERKDA